MDLTELYQDLILDHGKKPRNFGKCNKFNHDAEGHNPLCGDNIHVYLILDKEKKVTDISFEGSGCAISVASCSIMTEIVKGRSEKQARELLNSFFKMIKEGQEIKNIIRAFKQSMSPKKGQKGQGETGAFITSPDVFQLEYKSGGSAHKFLNRFKPMALDSMQVNYTASGTYATYSDATPIHMTMALSFKELSPIYNEDYDSTSGKLGVGY